MIYCYYSHVGTLWPPDKVQEWTMLPTKVLQRAEKFHRWEDKQLHIGGHMLLHKLIATLGFHHELNLNLLTTQENGKPIFHHPFNFNISHSGSIVICTATLKMPVGIDIEKIQPLPMEEFKPYFTESEWNKMLHSPNSLYAFYELWCRKEALSKVHGEGVSMLQQKLDVQHSPLPYRNSNYYFNSIYVHPDYCCVLCSPVPSEIHLQQIIL